MIKLNRFKATDGAVDSAGAILRSLSAFLAKPLNIKDENIKRQLDSIVEFQAEDGSFNVLDDPRMPPDAFVDFHLYPTVMCSAILMKAVLLYPEECRDYLPVLVKALGRVSEIGIGGDGYSYLDCQMEYLKIYIDAGLLSFLYRYADIQPRFTETIHNIRSSYERFIETGDFIHGFGQDYEQEIREMYSLLSHHRIFTYGTLMSGESNHGFISTQIFNGEGIIKGFNLFNLGRFPGIRHSKHLERVVIGEIFSVDSNTLETINELEGEGSLYNLEFAEVDLNGRTIVAGVYVYNHKIRRDRRIFSGDWRLPFVYIAYGSNMNIDQMKSRCPNARLLGNSILNNHSLLFRAHRGGRVVATVEECAGDNVPVVLWAIDKDCEKNLDRHEGFHRDNPDSSYYLKKKESVEFKGENIPGIIYVMIHGGHLGRPEYEYYNRILRGYLANGIDPDSLIKAVER